MGTPSAGQHALIKEQIHTHLRDNGVFSSLKAIVADALDHKENLDGGVAAAADLGALTAVQRMSVLARIVSNEASGSAQALGSSSAKAAAGGGAAGSQILLHVLLLGGRAFAEDDDGEDAKSGTVCVCLQFGAQRFRSRSVPLCAEPQLRDGVLLELPAPDADAEAAAAAAPVPALATLESLRAMARLGEPMHLLVLRQHRGRETLLSSCLLEWRQVLHHGTHTLSVELPGLGTQATLPAGTLEVKLELLPLPKAESRLTEAEVMLALKRERDAQVDAERKFFAYARAWWAP